MVLLVSLPLLLLFFFLKFFSLKALPLHDSVHKLPHVVGNEEVPIVPKLHMHVPQEVEVVFQPSLFQVLACILVDFVRFSEFLDYCGSLFLLYCKLLPRFFTFNKGSEMRLNFQGGTIVDSALILLILFEEVSLVPSLNFGGR